MFENGISFSMVDHRPKAIRTSKRLQWPHLPMTWEVVGEPISSSQPRLWRLGSTLWPRPWSGPGISRRWRGSEPWCLADPYECWTGKPESPHWCQAMKGILARFLREGQLFLLRTEMKCIGQKVSRMYKRSLWPLVSNPQFKIKWAKWVPNIIYEN